MLRLCAENIFYMGLKYINTGNISDVLGETEFMNKIQDMLSDT